MVFFSQLRSSCISTRKIAHNPAFRGIWKANTWYVHNKMGNIDNFWQILFKGAVAIRDSTTQEGAGRFLSRLLVDLET